MTALDDLSEILDTPTEPRVAKHVSIVDPANIEYVVNVLDKETGIFTKHETTFPLDCYTVAMWAKKLRADGHTVTIEKAIPPVRTVRGGKLLFSCRNKSS